MSEKIVVTILGIAQDGGVPTLDVYVTPANDSPKKDGSYPQYHSQ